MSRGARPLPLWLVLLGLAVAWWSKLPKSLPLLHVYRDRPLTDALFPAPLQRFDVLFSAYFAPGVLGVLALLWPRFRPLGLASHALGAAILLVHQGAYNDATFVTALWTSLIGLWLVQRERRGTLAPEHVATIAQLFVGVLFLGGLMGKLTPGYLDGSIFYDIYFVDRDYLPFRLAREWLTPDGVREAATVYSRFVLAVELLLASLPLWPARLGLSFAVLGLCGLVLLNNPYLISVVAAPLSLCVLGLWETRRAPTPAQ